MSYFILKLSAFSASIFALAIEILLYTDEKQVRKWILRALTLKHHFTLPYFE